MSVQYARTVGEENKTAKEYALIILFYTILLRLYTYTTTFDSARQ